MLKVILFNAAPRAGKGVAASTLQSHITDLGGKASVREFKDELFKIAANALNTSVEAFKVNYDLQVKDVDSVDRSWALLEGNRRGTKVTDETWWKDVPTISSGGMFYSQRSWLIHISENVIKPSFGEKAFGNMLGNSLPAEGTVLISDGGFASELIPVIEKVGEDNVTVVRLHREGCDFSNDSRNFLTEDMFNANIKFMDITNNGSLDEFELKLIRLWEEGKL